MIPTLITERLVLRAPEHADFEPYAEILASDRAAHIGGPFERYAAWLDFCMEVAGWTLRGFGALTITERKTERFLGLSILHHDEGDPERELGWVVSDAAEGRGIAGEATRAMRDYAFDTHGWESLVSYIAPGNARSIRLAERLGAVRDDGAARPFGFPDCLVFRHHNPEVRP